MKKFLLLGIFLFAIFSVFSFKFAPGALAVCAGPNGVTFATGGQYCSGDSYPPNGPDVGGATCAAPITANYYTCQSTGSFAAFSCGGGSACGYYSQFDVGCFAACVNPPTPTPTTPPPPTPTPTTPPAGGTICYSGCDSCSSYCAPAGTCSQTFCPACPPPPPPGFCGDGICGNSSGESCSTCPTDCGACAVIPTPTPTGAPVSGLGNVFVTSTRYNGNLGGLSGADAKCQTRASAAGLSGTWKAFLSDDVTSAKDRLTHSASPYYRMDGALIANNWTDLTDWSLASPINRTEFNNVIGNSSAVAGFPVVFTGSTAPDGTKFDGYTCINWTNSASTTNGFGGNANLSDGGWISYINGGMCDGINYPASLYCFKQEAVATYDISGIVYLDNNGNGVQDVGETGYSGGAGIGLTGGASADTRTTDPTGNYSFTFLSANTYTITLTVPAGYVLSPADTNPKTAPVGPSTIRNFGIQQQPPICTGLTANPTTVNPGQTSTLTMTGCPAGVDYTWPAPDYGTTTNVNNPTTTWTAPNPFWLTVTAHPSVQVCYTLTGICTGYDTQINIVPVYTVNGNVFLDDNKDQLKNAGESNYTNGITITSSGGTVTYPSPGAFRASLGAGTYTLSYTSLPVGYQMTYPLNGPPPSFNITVGSGCAVGGSNSAACDANGNITNLNYGITNSLPWIQSTGGDITGPTNSDPTGGGFDDPIPTEEPSSCQSYASVTGAGGTPGIIYAGAGSTDFGLGQASQGPYNWVVGGLTYPESYTPTTPGVIRTSYNYVNSIAQQSNITPVNLATYCGVGGIADCNLSSSIPNGLFIANGNLNLTGADYTFPVNKNFVILVNGVLTVQTEIHVPSGSTAFFTASGNINVASNVGEAVITSTASNIEGYYSTDQSFYVQGGNVCPTSDRRLNVEGSIVVNAGLNGGAFVNQRDLCAGNLQCPVFSIKERPDFTLNAPDFLKAARRVWQEVAP